LESVRIGFQREEITVRADNFVFVNGAFAEFGEEEFPDAGRATRTHRMDAAIPVIHVADDADSARRGSPDRKMRSGYACDGVEMSAEFFVGVEMAAFANEVKIEIGKKEWKSVRVEDFERLAGLGAALNFVASGFGRGGLIRRPDGLEESLGPEFDGVGNFCGGDDGILEDDAGLGGPGNEKPDGPSGGDRMRAENTEWVGVCAGEERVGAHVKIGERLRFGRQRR